MRAKDESIWAQQVTEINGSETGQRFLEFLTFWFDTAETLMFEGRGGFTDDSTNMSAINAVRDALRMAEEQFGFIDTDVVGQMLVLAATHWAHGGALTDGMSYIETRVMQQSLARKIVELQAQAAAGAMAGENPL